MNICNHCGKEFHDTDKEKFDRHLQYVHNISMQNEKQRVFNVVNETLRKTFCRDSSCVMCNTTSSNICWFSEKLNAELCKSCYDSLKSIEESEK